MGAPDPTVGLLWLGGSLLVAGVWANLSWFLGRPHAGETDQPGGDFVPFGLPPWLYQVLRLVYYIGVPCAALFFGRDAVIGRFLGVVPTADWGAWAGSLGWMAALGVGTWGLLALGWWSYRRALAVVSTEEETLAQDFTDSGWVFLREAVYHEIHWAFYRNAPVLLLWGLSGDETTAVYWGGWMGLGLVALEAVLNPAWRQALATIDRAPLHAVRGGLAVVSCLFFLKAGQKNLWLAVLLHWGVSWATAALWRQFPPLFARQAS